MKKISSNLFDNFLENNIEGIWVIDNHNKTTFVNSVTSELLGYPQEHFIGKEIKDYLEDEPILEQKLIERSNGIAELHELKFLTSDSEPVWVSAACSPLYNENEVYVGAVGLLTDITQRKKNDSILESQKNVFETLVKGGKLEDSLIHLLRPLDKLIKGVYSSILLIDESGEKLKTGVSIKLPEEFNQAINGKSIGLKAGSCGTSAFTKKLVISSDIANDPNWENYKELAEKFQLRACWSSPIISNKGKVLGTFAMYFSEVREPSKFEMELVNDISAAAALCIEHIRLIEHERKSYQRNDLLSEARLLLSGTIEYGDVLKKIPNLLVNKGICDWSFICLEDEDGLYRPNCVAAIPELKEASKPLESIEMDLNKNFGLCRAIKNNTSFIEVVSENQLMSLLSETGINSPGPYLAGILLNLQLREYIAVPLTIRNKVVGGMIVATTDANRNYGNIELELIKEIARSCAMAIDNALLYRESKRTILDREEFISIASHELRTPITSLKMRVDLLALLIEKKKFPKEVMDILTPIVSELQPDIRNFTKLIEALLDISKIGGLNFTLVKESCDLSKIITDEALKQKLLFETSKTELIINVQSGIKGVCDHTRIRQIINNLLSNALKFGNKKPVSLTLTSDGLNLTILLKDNGIGFSKEDSARIFKPFERAVSDQYFGGLGLGLYITEQIVKRHGGKIEAESKPGQGTTFKVEMPLIVES